MKRVKLHIHNKAFDKKPTGYEIGNISNTITKAIAEVSTIELAHFIGEQGRTALLSLMDGKRNSDNMIEQQILMLDFDDGDITIEKVLENQFVQDYASFLYKTFSHTEKQNRFRLVFILDEALTKKEEVESAYFWLFDKFPTTDKAVKDPARLFFGGIGTTVIDYSNTLPNNLLPEVEVKEEVIINRNDLTRDQEEYDAVVYNQVNHDTPTWMVIKAGDKEEVRRRWSGYTKGKAFKTNIEAINYISTLDMSKLLGVAGNPFRDILELDVDPSAQIWKSDKSNQYLYSQMNNHNTSTGGARTYTLEGVVGKLIGLPVLGAEQYLMEVFEISHDVSDEFTEASHRVNKFKSIILHPDLKELYEGIYYMIGRYEYPARISALLDVMLYQMFETEDGNIEMITWMSTRTIAESLGMSRKVVANMINVMTLIGAFNKLGDDQLSEEMFEKLNKLKTHSFENGNWVKREKEHQYRPTAIEISKDIVDIEAIEEKATRQQELGFTFKSMSRDWMMNTQGEKEADRVYPQDKGRVVSKEKQDLNGQIQREVLEQLADKGYVIINELHEQLNQELKGYNEYKYGQQEDILLSGYGLEKVRLTTDLKEKFGITHLSKHSSPSTIIEKE